MQNLALIAVIFNFPPLLVKSIFVLGGKLLRHFGHQDLIDRFKGSNYIQRCSLNNVFFRLWFLCCCPKYLFDDQIISARPTQKKKNPTLTMQYEPHAKYIHDPKTKADNNERTRIYQRRERQPPRPLREIRDMPLTKKKIKPTNQK